MSTVKRKNPFSFQYAPYTKAYNKKLAFKDSSLEVRVQDYNCQPTIVLAKTVGKGFISLKETEFYDLIAYAEHLNPLIKECKAAISEQYGGILFPGDPGSKEEIVEIPHSSETLDLVKVFKPSEGKEEVKKKTKKVKKSPTVINMEEFNEEDEEK